MRHTPYPTSLFYFWKENAKKFLSRKLHMNSFIFIDHIDNQMPSGILQKLRFNDNQPKGVQFSNLHRLLVLSFGRQKWCRKENVEEMRNGALCDICNVCDVHASMYVCRKPCTVWQLRWARMRWKCIIFSASRFTEILAGFQCIFSFCQLCRQTFDKTTRTSSILFTYRINWIKKNREWYVSNINKCVQWIFTSFEARQR